MTAVTNEMTVTIDDAIRARPELLAKVEEASDYFKKKYAELPRNEEWLNAKLRWLPSPGLPEFMRLIFQEEHPEYEGRIHFEDIPVSAAELRDEYGLTANMHRLLRRVTRARLSVSGKRLDRWILELDLEEKANV